MIRLIVVVEGQTEEAFVKEILRPHLLDRGLDVRATIVGKLNAQRRGHQQRGGGPFRHWQRDLQRLLRGDTSDDLRVTTLFDLYGLPTDFPGIKEAWAEPDTERRCDLLQKELAQLFDDQRLLPYLQRHEFEALVLASLSSLRELLDADDDLEGLARLEAELAGQPPEDVNDGKESAPSKRLINHIPGYRKTVHGPLAVGDTGLLELRANCPRFDAWVCSLEALA